jgi:drug/metabolite transporter (DMT)-like permease
MRPSQLHSCHPEVSKDPEVSKGVSSRVRSLYRSFERNSPKGMGRLHPLTHGHESRPVKYALLAGAQVAIGAAAIFARFALTGASPLAVAAARLAIAALVLLFIALVWRHHREVRMPRHDTILFVAAGVALAVHFASWIWSLEYTSVAMSTLLVATTPIWTALYDSLVHKQHLSRIAWGALAAGVAGLALVAGFTTTRPPVPGHEALGAILALLGGAALGAYFVLVREVRAAYETRRIVTRTYTWAAIVLVIAAAAAHQGPPAIIATQAWGGIFAMALISQLLGHTALNAALRWFSASAVAFTTLLEPVTAGVLAFFVFGERLTPTALAGGFLVLIAICGFLREELQAATA